MALSSCTKSTPCALQHRPSSHSLSLHHSKTLIKPSSLRVRHFYSAARTHANLLSHSSPSPITPLQSRIPKSNLRSLATTSDLSSADNSPPTPKTLKTRLAAGDILYGIRLNCFSPTIAEIAGLAGYDYVVVDMEHGHGGVSDALPCLHALAAAGTPAILRVPESTSMWAKKALDLGPQGIMFPMIDGPDSAKKAVSYCRFPLAGVRGSAHTVVRASRYGIDRSYLSNYEDNLLIMCQVESKEGAQKIEDIAAVDGVDCIQMGPFDLSASMGYLYDPGNKKVKEVMRAAEKTVLKLRTKKAEGGGGYLAGVAMAHDRPDDMRARGYHMVSGAADVELFRNAAVEDVRRFRLGLMKASHDDNVGDGSQKQDVYGKDNHEKYMERVISISN